MNGPTLKFNRATQIVLTGAAIEASVDGEPMPPYTVIDIEAGQVLSLGKVSGPGARAYLAVAGGFQCPDYLGSKSTFTLGQFGGHVGRALRVADVLHLADRHHRVCTAPQQLPQDLLPRIARPLDTAG